MLHDFPAGGAPDTFMRADVLERRVERADTMWLAGDERVHRDRHDARHGFALAIRVSNWRFSIASNSGTDTFISK